MKNVISSIITAALLTSCGTTILNNQAVNTGITLGTSTALQLAITDSAKRTQVANYIDVVAGALRTVTGTPTPAQLTTLINGFILASVKSSLPEVLAFVTPLIVSEYNSLYSKYGTSGNAAQIYAGINQIASDLEAGAAPFISH